MAASVCRAQISSRPRGSKRCSEHRGKEVVYFCETCTGLVCEDCVINEHKGHVFAGLNGIALKAKQKIKAFVIKLEETNIPLIDTTLQDAECDLSKNREHYKQQIKQIREKKEQLKEELDNIADLMVRTCRSMEDLFSNKILNHIEELSALNEKMRSHLQELKSTLQSQDNVLVYDAANALPLFLTNIPKPNCNTVRLTLGTFSLQYLEDMIGELNITSENRITNSTGKDESNESILQRQQDDLLCPVREPTAIVIEEGNVRQFTVCNSISDDTAFRYAAYFNILGKEKLIRRVTHEPKFQAIHDFKATNEDEISFKKDEIIHDVFVLDKNWMEGTVAKTSGRFPCSSVKRVQAQIQLGSNDTECKSDPIQYKTLFAHVASGGDEVSFVKGDIIDDVTDVGEINWMEGRVVRTGERGMFPINYAERVFPEDVTSHGDDGKDSSVPIYDDVINEIKYKALFDYDAAAKDETSFVEGDVIEDITFNQDGWMEGRVQRTRERGLIPSNYFERI